MEQAILEAAEIKFGQVIESQASFLLIKRSENDYMTIKSGLVDGQAQFHSGNYNMSLIEGALDLRDRATSTKTYSHTAYVVKLPTEHFTEMDIKLVEDEQFSIEALASQFSGATIQTLKSFQEEFNEATNDDAEKDYYIAFTNLINTGNEPV
jgi:hypothetical protein